MARQESGRKYIAYTLNHTGERHIYQNKRIFALLQIELQTWTKW